MRKEDKKWGRRIRNGGRRIRNGER